MRLGEGRIDLDGLLESRARLFEFCKSIERRTQGIVGEGGVGLEFDGAGELLNCFRALALYRLDLAEQQVCISIARI